MAPRLSGVTARPAATGPEVAPAPAAGLPPAWWREAGEALAAADPTMARVIADTSGHGHLRSRGDPFTTLARSIVGQQISVKAAQSVWTRFEAAAGTVTPARVARMRATTLTGAGLSGRKAEYLRDLASHFVRGTVDPRHWPGLDDEAVIGELVRVRGIGRWTAEMFLIFNLMRPDVFPVDDLGLLKALALHYNDGRAVTKAEAAALGERWRPWRTPATWYLWRSLDPLPVDY